ncbi:MAG: hypothetical protein R3D58_04865 [Saprospiraceae bacterium]|nr:hypothetical protein [Lewinellaceae bacterium]
MAIRLYQVIFLFLLLAVGCRKNDGPNDPGAAVFTINVDNEVHVLQAQYAIFLSDKNGQTRAFRWIPGNDTAQVAVPGSEPTDRFDCTVVKIEPFLAPGTGVRDTTVSLTTYTNLYNGANIHLHDANFLQSTDLFLKFTGISSVDSIVVPQGLTFAFPQSANNFEGHYRVLHTGRIWFRVRVNGESNWRYAFFENANNANFTVTVDLVDLPELPAGAATLSLPLLTDWDFELDRVIDLQKKEFLALGGNLRIPGGPIPVFDQLNVFEPPGLSQNNGYRLRISGFDPNPGGYGYVCDKFFQNLPAGLQSPNFDILTASVADGRWVSIQCSGFIDLLSFTRRYTGAVEISWEALVASSNSGAVNYRLPNVPAELGNLYPVLKNYAFDPGVEVRAEGYDKLNAYPEVIARMMLKDNPLWQMDAGYFGKIRKF